jgi:hypothetical protein
VYPRQDELVLKLSCRLANRYDSLLPDGCHAFRPGRSARTAFAALMKKPGLDKLACIRLAITDFFNAIPPEKALAALPEAIRQDMPLYALLKDTVLAQASTSTDGNRNPADTGGCHGNATGTGVRPGSSLRTGVRPGTPVAPCWPTTISPPSTANGWPQAGLRTLFGRHHPVRATRPHADTQARMAADLSALGLSLNDTKSHMHQAGEAWEFLGFSYDHGCIDLCDAAVRKIKNRVRRLARRLNRYRSGGMCQGQDPVLFLPPHEWPPVRL